MNVHLISDSDKSRWDAYVHSHPGGLAYHAYAWKTAVEKAYQFKTCYLAAESRNEICGVFPLVHHKPPMLKGNLVSLPYCDVGGILANDAEAQSALMSHALKLMEHSGAASLKIRKAFLPEENVESEITTSKVRMVLELGCSSDQLLSGLKAKLRSQVRKPARDGLYAKLGGIDLLEDFYNIFSENMRELGSPVHSRNWISEVILAFGGQSRIGMVYMPDGTPAAGGIILFTKRIVSIPWASSLRRLNRWNPNMLLYWTFLEFAADTGFEYFDFGRSTPGEGTYRFKAQWGAEPSPLVWTSVSPNGEENQVQSSSGRNREKIEALWRKMPLGVCNLLGPYLRKQIDL